MVGVSKVRDKYRSNALKQLAKERAANKRSKVEEQNDSDSDDSLDLERPTKKIKNQGDSLLSILPEPKNASSATFDLLSELLAKEKVNQSSKEDDSNPLDEKAPVDMIEVDVNKLINDTVSNQSYTVGPRNETVRMPKSKEKEKNQITHLAKLAKAAEVLLQEKAAQGRANRAVARSKYGW